MTTGRLPPERDNSRHPSALGAPAQPRRGDHDTAGRVVLLVDATGGIHVEPVTTRCRVKAAVLADRLDRMLAEGIEPESDVLLAIRAERLVAIRTRHDLARTIGRLVRAATEPEHPLSRASSMAVLSRVREVQPELEDLIDRLLAPVPVPARGMALVRLLLRDGTGPLFRYESHADLRRQVRCACTALDPAQDWPG